MEKQYIEIICAKCGEIKKIPCEKVKNGKMYIHIGLDCWMKVRKYSFILCEKCIEME
jgi:formylmethanofuran dehydrogenase subunit E